MLADGTRVNQMVANLLAQMNGEMGDMGATPDAAWTATVAGEAKNGSYDAATIAAARAWQARRKFTPTDTFEKRHWTALLSAGARTTIKRGSVASRPARPHPR